MSEPDPPRDDPQREEARAARNRLLGRILIVAMGLLALAQIIPAILSR